MSCCLLFKCSYQVYCGICTGAHERPTLSISAIVTLRGFNYLTSHHLLFGIRFNRCVLFIKYWFLERRYPSVFVPTYHLLFPFIVFSWCIVVFIDKLRTRNDEYANSVRYVSQQLRRNPFSQIRFPYQ